MNSPVSILPFTALVLLMSAVVSAKPDVPTFGSSSCNETRTERSYSSENGREIDFNYGWKFILADEKEAKKPGFDDSQWRSIRLPHDWSVELSFSEDLEGATAYLPGGIGWYRKTFKVEKSQEEVCYILFDGVYNNTEVWLNGKKLGTHPYGYSPFYYDLTDHLNADGENVLAVRVDHSRYVDSRWYTGSGIYRNVELIIANDIHVPVWGTFVKTPEVSSDMATVEIETTLKNSSSNDQQFEVLQKIISPSGVEVAKLVADKNLNAQSSAVIDQTLQIESPELWGIGTPKLYHLHTILKRDGKEVDRYITRFGIRSFTFDADKGFCLNGKNMKIKGFCLHHAAGLVGSAVPKEVWRRRLEALIEAGTNAIRISHNPGSKEFLELCDELGLLVQDEFFDEWDYPKDKRLNCWERHDDYISRGYADLFQEHAEKDLKTVILAHRNHPSIFQWSIGNEIEWTYPRNRPATGFFDNMNWDGNYFWSQPPYSPEKIREEYNRLPALDYQIETTAKKLSDWTKEMDTSRPVISNCILPSASFETGYADALDIVGFSYRRVMYDYAKEHYPEKVVMGTESVVQYHEWKAVAERDFVSGTFFWTGIDYMGEVNEQWPNKALASGILDVAGFKKPSFHMIKSLWTEEPHVYLCTQTAEKSQYKMDSSGSIIEKEPGAWQRRLWIWYDINEHWNYAEGENTIAEVYSNCPKVELFQNEKSLGVKELKDFEDHIYKWAVDFAAGELKAVGYMDGKQVSYKLETAEEASTILIKTEKAKRTIGGNDVVHVIAQLVDQNGNPVRTQEQNLQFKVSGPCTILGVDNGARNNVQDYQSDSIETHKGRALLIIRSTKKTGTIEIVAQAGNLHSNVIKLTVE